MSSTIVSIQARLRKVVEKGRDSGQGMLEYLGILVVAALLIVGVLTAMGTFKPEEKAETQISDISDALDNARG